MVAGGKHGESWQHHDPLVLDMYKKLGGASVMLRHFARMHEGVKLYRQAEHALREFQLNDPWYEVRGQRSKGQACDWRIYAQAGHAWRYRTTLRDLHVL
jgi:Ni,Fe-hydrogenase I large subunit